MTSPASPVSSILVDIELPDPAPLPPRLVDLLSSLRVVLVGWYYVPEQTSPQQARDQFGTESQNVLREVARAFEEAGAVVETRLVFTPNELDTLRRMTDEHQCNAVLLPADMPHLKRVLVPIRGLQNVDSIAPVVADLVQDGTTAITLFHVLEEGGTEDEAYETVLRPMADAIAARGVDAGLVQCETVEASDPGAAILERATDHDIVVLGETEPSIREILFGTVPETIAEEVNVPVVVVRHVAGDGLPVASARNASANAT